MKFTEVYNMKDIDLGERKRLRNILIERYKVYGDPFEFIKSLSAKWGYSLVLDACNNLISFKSMCSKLNPNCIEFYYDLAEYYIMKLYCKMKLYCNNVLKYIDERSDLIRLNIEQFTNKLLVIADEEYADCSDYVELVRISNIIQYETYKEYVRD